MLIESATDPVRTIGTIVQSACLALRSFARAGSRSDAPCVRCGHSARRGTASRHLVLPGATSTRARGEHARDVLVDSRLVDVV